MAGVADVAVLGGDTKEYQIDIDLNRLMSYGLTLPQVMTAISNSNANVGGRTISIGEQAKAGKLRMIAVTGPSRALRYPDVPLVAETALLGGARRAVRVQLDPVKLASRNLSPAGLIPMLQQANAQTHTGAQSAGPVRRRVSLSGVGRLTKVKAGGCRPRQASGTDPPSERLP